ncbi:MAG: hypothetical protein P0S95_06800 [Rhabdochlamydiaceae bacterium]|nr:hypothetical protein [Candidatus Amphrikana amoebophyrae]
MVNLGFGDVSEEKRTLLLDKIEGVCLFHGATQVDIVAHSMGGNSAFAALFIKECSTLDNGNLTFTGPKQLNSKIRKVVTLALPTTKEELTWLREANSTDQVYNVVAKYDVLMGHKPCGFDRDNSLKRADVSCGHIGIVYQPQVPDIVHHMLASSATPTTTIIRK